MTAPLYQGAFDAACRQYQPTSSHAGLWFDKFCDRWKDDFTDLVDDNAKRDWIRTVTKANTQQNGPGRGDLKKVGKEALIDEHRQRREALVAGCMGRLMQFKLESRFVSGLGRSHPVENGFAWHAVLSVPYLAGSGVKGMVRTWAYEFADVDETDITRIFGPEAKPGTDLSVGSVIFLDALPISPVQLVPEIMTSHYGPWYQNGAHPADWHNPTPIPFLAVETGTEFSFAVMPRQAGDTADSDQVTAWLKQALTWIGAGAKTATGMGRFIDITPSQPSLQPDNDAEVSRTFHDGRPIRVLSDEEDGLVEVQYLDEQGGNDLVPSEEIQ